MGGAQARGSAPRGADACTVVGRTDSVRGARACSARGTGTSRPVVGRAGEHLKACRALRGRLGRTSRRARALMGGACSGRTEHTTLRGSTVGSACSPIMGNVEEGRARGAGSAVVVLAIGCSAAASVSSATAARVCSGPVVVAARRVSRPA